MRMTIGSLFSGYGGLDLSIDGTTMWVAEIDAAANTVLAERFGVPNLGDITELDATSVPAVDIVTAGFPCQPVSHAGRRQGVDDDRWLFDDIIRVVGRMDPRPQLFLENVPGLLTANSGDALARVVEGLARIGYVGRYRLLPASAVGAPHRRMRWFCTAYPDGRQPERWRGPRQLGSTPPSVPPEKPQRQRPGHASDDRGATPPDATNLRHERTRHPRQRGSRPENSSNAAPHPDLPRSQGHRRPERDPRELDPPASHPQPAAHPDRERREERRIPEGQTPELPDVAGSDRLGPYREACEHWAGTIGRPAPDALRDDRLNPVFVEWMMGLPPGWVTDIDISRRDQLRILGNGVVPQQAALAKFLLDAGM